MLPGHEALALRGVGRLLEESVGGVRHGQFPSALNSVAAGQPPCKMWLCGQGDVALGVCLGYNLYPTDEEGEKCITHRGGQGTCDGGKGRVTFLSSFLSSVIL